MNTLVNEKVIFCAKCVESNQRYVSSIAFKDKKDSYKSRAEFDKETNICWAGGLRFNRFLRGRRAFSYCFEKGPVRKNIFNNNWAHFFK